MSAVVAEKLTLPKSWYDFPIAQGPEYADQTLLFRIMRDLRRSTPITPFSEITQLHQHLNNVYANGGLIFQGGECAELFEHAEPSRVFESAHLIKSMSDLLANRARRPTLTMGRIAGQFAKPRSFSYIGDGSGLYRNYFGDLINDRDLKGREDNPLRMTLCYQIIKRMHKILRDIKPLDFGDRFFTLHEAYHLPFEDALSQIDQQIDEQYASSAHSLWVGARTNRPDFSHVQFAKGIYNPVGVKVSSALGPDSLREILVQLQGNKSPVMLICRLGTENIKSVLPQMIRAARGFRVLWLCDPMHGNLKLRGNGMKVRYMADILSEVQSFCDILYKNGGRPSGLHCEMTCEDVLECLTSADDSQTDTMICDPRLNKKQAAEVIQTFAENIKP